ncbi:MAG: OmpA family protein [Acidobacteriia bacterium]|nr:OmpA family protein [Terriglobia bacterium]
MATPPIIIIKKKGSHAAHHGGAWKVAYADFVTALMALFIVLWLLNTSIKVQEAVGGYFRDPSGSARRTGTGVAGSGENLLLNKQDMAKLKTELQSSIQKMADLDKLKSNIEMTVTAEGLRIELLESEKGTFFDSGSSSLNQTGQEMLELLAAELGKVPNRVSVEGHTDSKPFTGKGSYSNWELSSDRANAARRLMQESGLRSDQVSQVRGFADQRLRNAKDSLDPSNRRVSIIVQYINVDLDEAGASGKDATASGERKLSAGKRTEPEKHE